MSLKAGELRHRLRIDQKIETRTDTGDIDFTWSVFKTIWGQMVPLSGREYLAAEQVQSQVIVRAKVRAGSGIEPTMRLVFRGIYYNIEAVLPDPDSWNEYENVMLSQLPGGEDPNESFNLVTESNDQLVTETGDLLVTG